MFCFRGDQHALGSLVIVDKLSNGVQLNANQLLNGEVVSRILHLRQMKGSYNRAVYIYVFATVLLLTLESARAAEWILEGEVIGVSDGDTIIVQDDAKAQHEVRFAGIDAPENAQAFGERSKQNLSALVLHKRVEARCHTRDQHGRQVCVVFVGLRDIGLAQIRAGMACWYREYAHVQRAHERELYRDAELAAKALRVGLWKEELPRAWEWRTRKGGE